MMNIIKPLLSVSVILIAAHAIIAQPERWQQQVAYKMDINFDVTKHQYEGKQNLVYTNNSPDTLFKIFYHLYLNAFQPGSAMDVRSRTIADPDSRVRDRISKLQPNEIGYEKVKSLKQDGKNLKYEIEGTILEVTLNEPILPGKKETFEMEWNAQIPIQIRRNGRDNAEGIAYSMAQWYPKLCEYDYQGWHANPYIAREFYGVWGDYDVKITMDKRYIIGASGYLQNPNDIGYGYTDKEVKPKGDQLTWHFVAPNVHDFVWAADPDYTHTSLKRADGLTLHFFYQKNDKTKDTWAALPGIMDKAYDFISKTFGPYQYKQYSFIQGGDGGMEYPMATLIVGEGNLPGLVSVATHEWMHSWYQMMLGSNESLYAWMDEGFASYAQDEALNYLAKQGAIPGKEAVADSHADDYQAYKRLALSGTEEPLSTHADHFNTNRAYSTGSYVKGAVFLQQLKYIIGEDAFNKGLLRYFDTWKFKHPNANDCVRIFEKQSGLELDWYKEYWVNSTRTIDYAINAVDSLDNQTTKITLSRIGLMPMPLDVAVTYKDGSKEIFNIALDLMRGNKPLEDSSAKFTILKDWQWVNPSYEFIMNRPLNEIMSIEIDPSGRLADIKRENNKFIKN